MRARGRARPRVLWRSRLDGYGVPVIEVDDPRIDAQPKYGTATCPAPDDIAHIIYTSGTTGVPKVLRLPIRT